MYVDLDPKSIHINHIDSIKVLRGTARSQRKVNLLAVLVAHDVVERQANRWNFSIVVLFVSDSVSVGTCGEVG